MNWHIRKLEGDLNTRQLERSGSGVRLTKSGELVCGLSDGILERVQEIKESIGGQTDAGTRIALGLPPAVS